MPDSWLITKTFGVSSGTKIRRVSDDVVIGGPVIGSMWSCDLREKGVIVGVSRTGVFYGGGLSPAGVRSGVLHGERVPGLRQWTAHPWRQRIGQTYPGPSITGCDRMKSSFTSAPMPGRSSGRTQPSAPNS